MANYYTYGEIPDVEQAFSGGLDFVSRADLLDQMPAFSAPATIAPSSGGGSSAPTWYRWSDGTYNRNPESTGIRTPYDQLPDQYKQIDSRRPAAAKEAPPPSPAQPPELVTEPDKGFMRTGPGAPVGGLTPLPEEPPVGPPPLSLLDDEGLTPAPEPEPSVEMFNWPDGTRRAYPPPPEISGLAPAPQGPSGLGSIPSQELPVAPPAIVAPSQELNRPQALPTTLPTPQPPTAPLSTAPDTAVAPPAPIPPGLEAALLRMQGKSPEQLAANAEAAAQTKPQREVLSNLLQTGQFDEAFKYAKEQGVQNLLIDPTQLKTLRGPFSNDEMQSFFAAMPKDLMGEQDERAVKFTPDKALEQSLQVSSIPREGIAAGPLGDIIGYPDVQRAFEPQELVKEPNAFDKLIKAAVYAGLAFAGSTALAGSSALGKAIVQLPETIGIKVGEALGANALSSVQAKMIGNAIISGGVTGAKGGDLEDILKSAAIAAGLTYVSDKAIKTISESLQKTGVTDAVKNIPGGDVTAVDPSVAADVAGNVSQALDQFTVTAFNPAAAAGLATTAGALAAAQDATPTGEREVKVTAEAEKPIETPPVVTSPVDTAFEPAPEVGDKQEVKVEAPAEKPVETPPIVTSPIDQGFQPAPTVEGKQEVKVEAPATKPVETPPVVVTSPIDQGFKPAPTVGDKQQVTVEAPAAKPVETPPVVVTGPVDTAFEPAPEVGGKQEVKVEAPADKPVEAPPVVVTPPPAKTETPPEKKKEEENPLKALLDKYGTLENFLKLLGALGAAGAKTPKSPVTTPTLPTGGMGGALPKYTYTRQQLSPDIDYYTYGTRPEAKFFDYGVQLEKPTQPELPPAKPPGDEPVMAKGGLMGYAKGGSNKSRYFDGPGSGREDKIPALLSDGEYVMDAETLALLGDGSTKEGARRMDQFRAKIRQHKGRALSRGQISPDAKSPNEYMGGGLA